MDMENVCEFNRGKSFDASVQISVHIVQQFQIGKISKESTNQKHELLLVAKIKEPAEQLMLFFR